MNIDDLSQALIGVAILVIAVVIHEVAHAVAADKLGDPTARLEGRITLNPISHIDPIGSIALPLVLFATGSPILFGWAKPVPYNPYNVRFGRWGEVLVALAGPAINFVMAIFFALVLSVTQSLGLGNELFAAFLMQATMLNIVLAMFNMIPIPPLDGSKLLFALVPQIADGQTRQFLDRWGMLLAVLFITSGFGNMYFDFMRVVLSGMVTGTDAAVGLFL